MAAISGTNVLLYSNGQAIALQKGLNFGYDCDLPDATNKESGGWAEYIVGLINATINFNALYATGTMTDNPKVLSGKDLIDYIRNSTEILVAILGGPFPIVGKAMMSSISLSADNAQPMALTGNLKINGKLYALTGSLANLITNPADSNTYDTFTRDGLSITSAIKSTAGDKLTISNTLNIVNATNYKLITYLTLNSGAAPKAKIFNSGGSDLSNEVVLTAGINIITLLATGDDANATVRLRNTANGNWSTTPIYFFLA